MIWAYNELVRLMDSVGRDRQRGGHFQFLTNQGLVLAEATLALCLLSDYFPDAKRVASARRILLMITMPLSVVVSLVYWTMFALAPVLIIQSEEPTSEPAFEPKLSTVFGAGFGIPLEVDVALHFAPLVTLVAHFFLLERNYGAEVKRLCAPLAAALFTVWYAGFQEWCASYNGTFTYPFLNVALPLRLCIYLGTMLLARGSFSLLNGIHSGKPVLPEVYGVPKQTAPVR